MTHRHEFFQLFYVSQLAPGSAFSVVNDIVATARRFNAAHGITGALVFDGEYFGQLIEGNEADVRALMSRIEADPRHVGVRRLHAGPADGTYQMRAWRSGYCDPQQLEGFAIESGLQGPAALAAFLSILLSADIE